MKKSVRHILLTGCILALGSLLTGLYAQSTYTSAQSGNFSVGSTWVGGQAPPDMQNIVIKSGHTVTLDRGTDWNDWIYVWDVTIEAGAVLESNNFPLWIRTTLTSNPRYRNDGIHNGPGSIMLNDFWYTRITGSGVTNTDFEIYNYGMDIEADCDLTINGTIKPMDPFIINGNTWFFMRHDLGGSLTVNGDLISPVKPATNLKYVLNNFIGSLTVNGNITFAGASDVIENRSSLIVSGSLTLGSNTTSFFWNRNQGYAEIGGDVLGGGSCILRHGNSAHIKFGGQVFPAGFGGTLQAVTFTDLTIVEYNGTAAQVVKPFGTTAYRNLIISNSNATASIEAAVTANTSLVIKPGAALTVSSGSLTIGAAATFTIESNATGTGSFISNSTVNANLMRYIAGHNEDADHGWHLLSSPVANQAVGAFHTAGSGDDFYKWDEVNNLWINRTAAGGGINPAFETEFGTGTGYLVANVNTSTKSFNGALNVYDVGISGLSYTSGNANAGWHLLGNPFSSALIWNDGNWALNNVDANCQIWNEANASYSVIAANDIIPATNGFMVRANQNNASLTIPSSSRVHSNINWYKNQQQVQRILLTAVDNQGQTAQPTIIHFDASATDGYDIAYDSYFLSGYAPQFFSIGQQEESYALNTLPSLNSSLTIPLGFVKNSSDNFTIELTENGTGQTVYLTDHKVNITHNLNEGAYTFMASSNDLVDRFTLHFSAVGINNPESDQSVQAWFTDGRLYLVNSEPALVNLYDLHGRQIYKQQVYQDGMFNTSLSLSSGIYVVQVQGKTFVKSIKINVQ